MTTRWLDEEQQAAWVRLIAVVELLPGVLDSQLRRDADLSHFEYFLLAMLSEAPERTLRMTALGAADQRHAAPPLPRRTPTRGPRSRRALPLPRGRPGDQRTADRRRMGQGRRDGAGSRRDRARARHRRPDPEADALSWPRSPRRSCDGSIPTGRCSRDEHRTLGHADRGAGGEEPVARPHRRAPRDRLRGGGRHRRLHLSGGRPRGPRPHRALAIRPDPQGRTTRAGRRLDPSAGGARRPRAPRPRGRRRGARARARRRGGPGDLAAPGRRPHPRGRGSGARGRGRRTCCGSTRT